MTNKVIQILTILVLFTAFVFNFFIFWNSWIWEWKAWTRVDPFSVTRFEDIDSRFLDFILNDTWLSTDDLKQMMESSSWMTLTDVLSINGIEFKIPQKWWNH